MGDGLEYLLTSPEVQMYLANTSSRSVLSNKSIYQHGALRKVNRPHST